MPARKTTAKDTKAKRPSTSKAKAKKPSASKATSVKPGDLIVIDSPQVGSPPREGEILKATVGAFSVSYQVRWGDGHETTISPAGGTARIIRS